MPRLNLPGCGHVAPAPVAGWQWLPIASGAYQARIQAALCIINARILSHSPCNAAFRALPGGRTLAQVWADPQLWISYDPGGQRGRFGATLRKEITLSQYACRMGHWTLVATIVHELAHVGGADGRTHAAEATLRRCLMAAHHQPTIMGRLGGGGPRDGVLATIVATGFRRQGGSVAWRG